ncbi:MAG: Hsp20/alpha crystallin family protein [Aeriscardovia sp.]|nr:Hsp20/alpha crystallin family protein [Aeriscardovia sp.]
MPTVIPFATYGGSSIKNGRSSEFSYSNYEQSYTLPDDVVKDQISAKVEDGILTVTMPKMEPKQKVTKAIEVS